MPIQLKPRSKLQIYAQSAQIIRDFLISKDSFRNLVYAPSVEEKKSVFALVIQTLKYRNLLLFILSLAQIPGCLYHELVQYDCLLGKISAELASMSNANENSDNKNQTEQSQTKLGKHDKPIDKSSLGSKTEPLFTTRTDKDTIYYENMLFQTKKSRLLWSQDQTKKEQEKTAETQQNNAQFLRDNDNSEDSGSDGEDSNQIETDKDQTKSTRKDASVEDEGDTTGISNSWFSAFITYTHQTRPTGKQNNQSGSSRPRQLTSKNPNTQTTNQTASPTETTYRYPIECLLVLTYDLLFGSKELPKLNELKIEKKNTTSRDGLTLKQAKVVQAQAAADARLKTFQQGIIDCTSLFNLPNPPKPLTHPQLQARAKLIKNGKSYTEIDANSETIDREVAEKLMKKDKRAQKAPKSTKGSTTSKPETHYTTILSFPIIPHHYLNTAPALPPLGEYSIGPGVTFKQRLATSLKYITTLLPIKPDSTPQQVQQQQHPDLFIPHELRGHYKRAIPRYIRINTNKVSQKEIIDSLIKEHNYTQLDVIPHMFQFPRPVQLQTPLELENGFQYDQFDTKLPGFLDKDSTIAKITPNLRRATPTWQKYLPIIERTISERVGTKQFATFLSQTLHYKQSTAAERQLRQSQNTARSSTNIFWVDPVLPDVLCFAPRDDTIVHSELVKDGSLIIQDRSSCLPPAILNPPLNSICIDACSAPGNKTSYLSAMLKNTGKVYAIELNQTRAKLMQNRMNLTNSKNVEVVQTSFFDILPTDPKYNRVEYIMLDPSCSGSGNIHTPQFLDILLSTSTMISPFSKRQHLSQNTTTDDIQSDHQGEDKICLISPPSEQLHHVESLSRLQIRLIKHALSFPNLKAFIYSTCSVYHLENENVVLNVLPIAQQLGFELVSALPLFPGRGVNHPGQETDGKTTISTQQKTYRTDTTNDDDLQHKSKKSRGNISENGEDKGNDQVVLGGDLNKTVRVDHSLYSSGGFYVALFAKPGTYPTQLLDSLLEETREQYPKHFQ